MNTTSTFNQPFVRSNTGRARPVRFRALALLLLISALAGAGYGQVIRDDFNDGGSDRWTEYDPLGTAGLGAAFASFSFISGAYRIQAFPSPAPTQLGPGRAGAYRETLFTNFYVSVDVVNFDREGRPAFGLLARMTNASLGQTTGYSFTYDPSTGPSESEVDFNKIQSESPTDIPTGPSKVYMQENKTYRFVFIGKGPNLEGRVYELPNVATPLVTITATDTTFTNGGFAGMVLYDNSANKNTTVDVTFDNFLAAPVEPPTLTIFRNEWGDITLTWPASAEGFELQQSTAVSGGPWNTVPASEYGAPSNGAYIYTPYFPDVDHYYRLYAR